MDGPGNAAAGRLDTGAGPRKAPAVIGASLVIAASLAAGGCAGRSTSTTAACLTKPAASAPAAAQTPATRTPATRTPAARTPAAQTGTARRAPDDWDLQDPPLLTSANGQSVVIDGGKAGILIELNAQTGKLIWKRPVGVHRGHENDGLLTEYARPGSHFPRPARFCLEPGVFGGIESQLATNGSATFAAVNDLPVPMSRSGVTESATAFEAAISGATGEMVAVNQDTGTIEWDDKLPSSPYGAATVTNNVVFTTTFHGGLYAFNTATGAILLNRQMPAGSNAPVTIDGDYVIAGAGVPQSSTQRPVIIAYKLGGRRKT